MREEQTEDVLTNLMFKSKAEFEENKIVLTSDCKLNYNKVLDNPKSQEYTYVDALANLEELNELLASLKAKASRGLSVSEKERTRLTAAVEDKPQIDIEVNFDFNSNDVTERARPLLMALGRAIQKLDAKGGAFIVAGHTDRKGKQGYNQPLSERRAQSVKDFLVRQFNIPDDKLIVVGYGHEQLKLPSKPYADENRRVQIVNATSSVASAAH